MALLPHLAPSGTVRQQRHARVRACSPMQARPALIFLVSHAPLCHNAAIPMKETRPPPASSKSVAFATGWRVALCVAALIQSWFVLRDRTVLVLRVGRRERVAFAVAAVLLLIANWAWLVYSGV